MLSRVAAAQRGTAEVPFLIDADGARQPSKCDHDEEMPFLDQSEVCHLLLTRFVTSFSHDHFCSSADGLDDEEDAARILVIEDHPPIYPQPTNPHARKNTQ
jgi:hypothetical protein